MWCTEEMEELLYITIRTLHFVRFIALTTTEWHFNYMGNILANVRSDKKKPKSDKRKLRT